MYIVQLTLKGVSLTLSFSSTRTGKQKSTSYAAIDVVTSCWDMVR
jgi:hypothetical protein